jgi:hypothetical protein
VLLLLLLLGECMLMLRGQLAAAGASSCAFTGALASSTASANHAACTLLFWLHQQLLVIMFTAGNTRQKSMKLNDRS